MEPRDLEQIDTFLGMVGKTSLLDYYELDAGVSTDLVEKAIKRRRGWAQGQQANPKFRNEALWLIKNNALLRRVLVEHRETYVEELSSRSELKNLQVLSLFIKGTLAGGTLTADAEQAILRQARTMGLNDETTNRQIETLLKETGARRAAADEPETGTASFVDYYGLIEIDASATLDEIESAHRAKYRWARTLKDKDRVTRLYAHLDEAWRVLKDPLRRAQYDAIYRAQQEGRQTGAVAEDIQGFLPGRTAPPPPALEDAPTVAAPIRPPPTRRRPPPPPPGVDSSRSLSFGGGLSTERTEETASGSTSAPPVRPPRPPEGIRTLGLSSSKRQRGGPRLSVASPELIVIEVGRSPVQQSILVKNTGRGQMQGRASSDRDWLELGQTRLDPSAAEQELPFTVHPRRMPRAKSVALVTIVTDHGERRAITVRVEKKRSQAPLFLVGALVLAAATGAGLWASGLLGGPGVLGEESTLTVRVDPLAEAIIVDGKQIGSGRQASKVGGFPIGKPFVVSATHDGFVTAEKTVTIQAGAVELLELDLELENPLDAPPTSGLEPVPVDLELFDLAINSRQEGITRCLLDANRAAGGTTRTLTMDVYIDSKGKLIYLSGADMPGSSVRCLRRHLRTAQFPLLDGDYAVVEGHTMTVSLPAPE